MHKQRRKKISKFASVAIFGLFWPFLGIFGHNLGSTNVRKLVLVSNIMFWDELFGKNFLVFFGTQKKSFFGLGGAISGTLTPWYNEILNFD